MQNNERNIPDNYKRLILVDSLKELFDTAANLNEDDPANVILYRRDFDFN
jgi:uncharacterized protein YeeX (DUF496 family)